jgi:hypothetical protein
MKHQLCRFIRIFVGSLLLGLGALPAMAAITCLPPSITSVNFAYVEGTTAIGATPSANNIMSNEVTVVCTRNLASDPMTVSLASNSGNNPTVPGGSLNQGKLNSGGVDYFIRYNAFRNAGCTQSWGTTNATRLVASFVSAAAGVAETLRFPYWGCMTGASTQSFTGSPPNGLYIDQLTLTFYAGNISSSPVIPSAAPGVVNVNIYAPAKCSITGLATTNTIVFNYTAFGVANFKFATFNANCTNLLPYTMSLSTTSGVVSGLKYQLGLSNALGSASAVGTASLASTGGTLGTKVHYINAVMDAGQAGTSGAAVPQSHTLTITY